jgi:excinuclease ABC subunit B
VTGALPPKPVTEPGKRFSPLLEGQPERGSADDPRPIIRAKAGAGSYEDAGDAKRQKRTKGKTGRPGR